MCIYIYICIYSYLYKYTDTYTKKWRMVIPFAWFFLSLILTTPGNSVQKPALRSRS